MLNVGSSVVWTIFLPSTWLLLFLLVYGFVHMRKLLRTQDVILCGLLVRYLFESVICLPIVIHHTINSFPWTESNCRAVIWFSQTGYLASLGLTTALVADVSFRMGKPVTNSHPVSHKFKLIGFIVLWILVAILAGILPAHQWTWTTYAGAKGVCSILPFQQNKDYAIGVMIFTAICFLVNIFIVAESCITIPRLQSGPGGSKLAGKKTEELSREALLKKRIVKRLVNSWKVALLVCAIISLLAHFPTFVINIHGLIRPSAPWADMVTAHYWMVTLECCIFPLSLYILSPRYRHPLYYLFNWVRGLQKPDHVCALEMFDRNLKVSSSGNIATNYGVMQSGNASTATSVLDRGEYRDHSDVTDGTVKPNKEVDENIYRLEVHEELCTANRNSTKRAPPNHWLNEPELPPKNLNAAIIPIPDVELDPHTRSNSFDKNRKEVTEETFVASKVTSEYSARQVDWTALSDDGDSNWPSPSDPNQQNGLEEFSPIGDNEEIKEATIVLDDDQIGTQRPLQETITYPTESPNTPSPFYLHSPEDKRRDDFIDYSDNEYPTIDMGNKEVPDTQDAARAARLFWQEQENFHYNRSMSPPPKSPPPFPINIKSLEPQYTADDNYNNGAAPITNGYPSKEIENSKIKRNEIGDEDSKHPNSNKSFWLTDQEMD